MPELAELWQMAALVRRAARGHVFTGVSLSEVARRAAKHPAVRPPWGRFTIDALSRGKEMRLTLEAAREAGRGRPAKRARGGADEAAAAVHVLIRCGMSGHIAVTGPGEPLAKHAHLRFHRQDGAAVCFVDARRFGSWHVLDEAGWGNERGPCPVSEHDQFVEHVREALPSRAFNRRIGDVLLDQRYFNGIGNYLRAEILWRAGVSPFVSAREALAPELEGRLAGGGAAAAVKEEPAAPKRRRSTGAQPARKAKAEEDVAASSEAAPAVDPDERGRVLHLSRKVAAEVIEHGFLYAGADGAPTLLHGEGGAKPRYDTFKQWLRCYGKTAAVRDATGRTLWYSPHHKVPAGVKRIATPRKIKATATSSSSSRKRKRPAPIKAERPAAAVVDKDEEAPAVRRSKRLRKDRE